MDEKEILSQILDELKKMNETLQEIKGQLKKGIVTFNV